MWRDNGVGEGLGLVYRPRGGGRSGRGTTGCEQLTQCEFFSLQEKSCSEGNVLSCIALIG